MRRLCLLPAKALVPCIQLTSTSCMVTRAQNMNGARHEQALARRRRQWSSYRSMECLCVHADGESRLTPLSSCVCSGAFRCSQRVGTSQAPARGRCLPQCILHPEQNGAERNETRSVIRMAKPLDAFPCYVLSSISLAVIRLFLSWYQDPYVWCTLIPLSLTPIS
jgi:hypothetical protein